jgi:hypothetical protein
MKTRMKTFDVWFTDVDGDGEIIDFSVEAPRMWIDIQAVEREEWLNFKQAVNVYVKGTSEIRMYAVSVEISDNSVEGCITLRFFPRLGNSACSIDFTVEEWALLKKRINAFTDTLLFSPDETQALKGLKEPKDRV